MIYSPTKAFRYGGWRLLNALYVLLLAGYVLAGTSSVPFHGDESTTIWMSRDYGYIFLDENLTQVRYADPPINATEQHLRLITGSLTKYLMGLSWSLNGYQTDKINEQWDWGADWNYNINFGHTPDDKLLMLGRWSSSIMVALSIVALFAIGWQIAGRPAAYISSLLYVINPVVLLNGRRAMFEGGLLLFSLLVVLVGVYFLKTRRNWLLIMLGVVSRLALSAKHPVIFTVFPVYVAIAVNVIWEQLRDKINYHNILRWLLWLSLSTFTALLVFYLMNPVWWGDPISRVGHVIDARSQLLQEQTALYGRYVDRDDQLAGLLRQMFVADPQYYEVDGWNVYIGEQINRYEDTIWSGSQIGRSILGAFLLALITCIGFLSLVINANDGNAAAKVVAFWSVFAIVVVGIATPLEWQRYYLMLQPIVALTAGFGVVSMMKWGSRILSTTTLRSALAQHEQGVR